MDKLTEEDIHIGNKAHHNRDNSSESETESDVERKCNHNRPPPREFSSLTYNNGGFEQKLLYDHDFPDVLERKKLKPIIPNLIRSKLPEAKINHNKFPEEIIKQNKFPKKKINKNKLPEEKINQNILPEKKIIQNKLPEKKIIQNKVPEKKINHNKFPEKKIKENKLQEEKVDQNKVPEGKVCLNAKRNFFSINNKMDVRNKKVRSCLIVTKNEKIASFIKFKDPTYTNQNEPNQDPNLIIVYENVNKHGNLYFTAQEIIKLVINSKEVIPFAKVFLTYYGIEDFIMITNNIRKSIKFCKDLIEHEIMTRVIHVLDKTDSAPNKVLPRDKNGYLICCSPECCYVHFKGSLEKILQFLGNHQLYGVVDPQDEILVKYVMNRELSLKYLVTALYDYLSGTGNLFNPEAPPIKPRLTENNKPSINEVCQKNTGYMCSEWVEVNRPKKKKKNLISEAFSSLKVNKSNECATPSTSSSSSIQNLPKNVTKKKEHKQTDVRSRKDRKKMQKQELKNNKQIAKSMIHLLRCSSSESLISDSTSLEVEELNHEIPKFDKEVSDDSGETYFSTFDNENSAHQFVEEYIPRKKLNNPQLLHSIEDVTNIKIKSISVEETNSKSNCGTNINDDRKISKSKKKTNESKINISKNKPNMTESSKEDTTCKNIICGMEDLSHLDNTISNIENISPIRSYNVDLEFEELASKYESNFLTIDLGSFDLTEWDLDLVDKNLNQNVFTDFIIKMTFENTLTTLRGMHLRNRQVSPSTSLSNEEMFEIVFKGDFEQYPMCYNQEELVKISRRKRYQVNDFFISGWFFNDLYQNLKNNFCE